MKRSARGVEKSPDIMIIPMIDIVFFLLVFFMVSSLYMNTEQQVPLNLPKASASSAKSIEPISVTLKENGDIFMGQEPVSLQEFSMQVKDLVSQNPHQPFVIRADKQVVYDKVITILDELKTDGAKYVSVATERK